ncbi:MAG: inositol monophosphatase [Kiritimatiellae bacterium]|nr:inositol monophosphatase [Kiritimatiellia bacterium]
MSDPDSNRLLEVAAAAAETAGAHALRHYSRRARVLRSLEHDVKLELDVECQQVATRVIRSAFPDHAILGEEGGHDASAAGFRWIIDPIDGTVNFTHGLPVWCCSIAVEHQGRTRAGAVRLPMLDELYTATADGEARRNGEVIRVSDTPEMAEGMVYTGVLEHGQDGGISHRVFRRLAEEFRKVRILGSAAVELCYVACGRGDAYIETTIHLWDLAAGALLVERAGGRGAVFARKNALCMSYGAANGRLAPAFESAMREAMNSNADTRDGATARG